MFDTEDADRIVALYQQGIGITELSERFQCSNTPIRSLLKERGVELRPRGRAAEVRDDRDIQRIVDAWNAGVALKPLAKKHGMAVKTLAALLRSQGIEPEPRPTHGAATPDQVKALYDEGLSGPQIAERLGISNTQVYRLLAKIKVSPSLDARAYERRGNRKFDPATEREIAEAYIAGKSIAELAEIHEAHDVTIASVLERQGVEKRPLGNPLKIFAPEEIDDVIRRYQNGESQQMIAEAYGASQSSISKIIRDRGIPTTDRQQGETHSRWNGGKVALGGGYVGIWTAPDDPMASMRLSHGYVPEHRLVMAQALGRPLYEWETVHHLDGQRSHNDISNLQLRIGNHGKGIALRCACCHSIDLEPYDLDD